MTLKEKFVKIYEKYCAVENIVNESEKISDDYAIDFLYWYCDNGQWMNMNLDVKELLEIFKKEKAL